MKGAFLKTCSVIACLALAVALAGWTAAPEAFGREARQAEGDSVTVTADFSGSPRSGSAPLTVEFNDRSSLASDDNVSDEISDWEWAFGDGGTSGARNPTHTYNSPGSYDVTLTVTTTKGFTDTTTKTDYISVSDFPAPEADFISEPASRDDPVTVRFINRSTGPIDSYSWDFGDGSTSDLSDPAHTYENLAVYTVTLTVTGPGGEDSRSVPVVLPVNIFRVGGSLAGPVVKVTTNTHLYESVELFLVTSAPNGLGRLFISVEAPSVSEWSDYMWFHPGEGSPLAPREGRVPPPRLVLVKDALGFLQDAHHHFYVDDYLKRNSPDELFEIGDIEGLKGETVIFKSWHLQEGLTFSEETLKMIQSVEINFI